MKNRDKGITLQQPKQNLSLLLALIAAGLAGNYFKFPIFLNIDFIFGSIFAMLALQYFGLGRGIPAAAIIAGYTYFLWNHPYAIVIMTAEVAVVGLLMERRKMGMVLADALYWLIIGMPLVYVFYHLIMHVPFSNTSIVMTKQTVNGIANALVARLIFTGYALRSRSSLMSYSEIVYNLLAFFVLCPALIMLAIGSRTDFNETDRTIRTTLIQDSRRVTDMMKTWVVNRKSAILNLADMAASRSPWQLQPYLEQAKKSDVNFLRIGLLDREARTTAFFPPSDELGRSNIGKNFADRPFIPILKQTLKPMLSEVVMGRIGTPTPVVQIVAPVVIRGEYGGYVTGILNLEQLREQLDKSTDENAMLYTLLDKNGNVIMTNRTDLRVMTPFVRGRVTINNIGEGLSQWVPILPLKQTPFFERWKNSFYVAETAIGDLAEWKLILEQPVAPFQKTLYESYTGKLTMLFLILLGALVLAELLSRKIVATLGQLGTLTRELPVRLAIDDKEIAWPESGIEEAHHLINNFREMGDSLTAQFNKVRQINESLEQRVDERTNQLAKAMHDLNFILENAPIGISKIIDRKWVLANRKIKNMFQYSTEEMEFQTTRKLYPSDEAYEKLVQEAYPLLAQGLVFEKVQELIRKDGVHILVRYIGKAVEPPDMSKGILWLMEDITERKRAEEALRKSEALLRALFDSSPVGIELYDREGLLIDANRTCLAIFGIADIAAVKKFKLFDDPNLDDLMKQALRNGRTVEKEVLFDFDLVRKLGLYPTSQTGQIVLDLFLSPFRSDAGEVEAGYVVHVRDITERKKAEEALQQSEKRYRELFENMQEGFMIQDVIADDAGRPVDIRYLDVNPAMERFLGKTRAEIIGRTRNQVLGLPDPEVVGAISRVANTGQPFHMVRYSSGAKRWYESFSYSFVPGQVATLVLDITERKQTEVALQRREKQLAESQRIAHIGSWQRNLATGEMFWSDELFRIFRLDPKADNVDFNVFFDMIHPDDRPTLKNAIDEVIQFNKPYSIDYRIILRDGTTRIMHAQAELKRDETGAQAMLSGTAQDITERKLAEEKVQQSEAKYRNLFESSTDGIFILDLDGYFIDMNSTAYMRLGYTKEEMLGLHISKLDHPEFVPRVPERMKQILERGFAVFESAHLRKDGTAMPVEINSRLIEYEGRAVLLSVIRDITERKKAEKELTILNQELQAKATALERAYKDMESFSYSISHDLRAPLRIIIGFSDILLQDHYDKFDDDCKELLKKIIENTQRIDQLVLAILDLSRTGRHELDIVEINMEQAASLIAGDLKAMAPERTINIDIKKLPHAHGDLKLIRQVLTNLLSNAVKFTKDRDFAAIEVGGWSEDHENVYFVKDNGAGFAMANADRLFKVFQRLHTAKEFQGIGIGLSIVDRIIKRHGGRLWAEGKPAEGATFYFTLPKKEE